MRKNKIFYFLKIYHRRLFILYIGHASPQSFILEMGLQKIDFKTKKAKSCNKYKTIHAAVTQQKT